MTNPKPYPECCTGCDYAVKNAACAIDCTCYGAVPENCYHYPNQQHQGDSCPFDEQATCTKPDGLTCAQMDCQTWLKTQNISMEVTNGQ